MLWAPPATVEAELFSAMPAAFRRPGVRTDWADANRGGAAVDSFLEGPAFDREGFLLVTDIPFGRIFRIAPDGTWSLVVEYEGWPNGLKLHREGWAAVTDYRRGVLRLDPRRAVLEPLVTHRFSEGFRGVNDCVFSSGGDLYFTDQGQTGLHDPTGRVYRYTAAGRLDCLLTTVPSPNGIVLAPDEKALFVAATRGNAVWRGPLMADGTLSKVGVFASLYGPTGPDGLAMDEAGNLVVAHPGGDSVWLFSPRGEPVLRVRCADGDFPTNVAHGGPDRRSLYITCSGVGVVRRAAMTVPGRRLFSHA